MNDADILSSISSLADEEHHLREAESGGSATDADRDRIGELDELLDQCWDLLRQRRARREAGLDPDEARARTIDTVEGYQQ